MAALARRRKSALTLSYVDLDDFKAVNDAHGHVQGDRILRVVGPVLQGSVRATDTAARLGGDEFALVFPDTASSGAQQVISKLASELQEALDSDGWRVTCSIGVVTFLDSERSAEDAVATADKLMYQVKQKGKGAVAFRVMG